MVSHVAATCNLDGYRALLAFLLNFVTLLEEHLGLPDL